MIVQGEDEERFWILVNNVIENRTKINELLDLTDERTKERDEQIQNIHAEIKDLKREIMEYHNLLLKQSEVIQNATDASRESQKLFETLTESITRINNKLGIDRQVRTMLSTQEYNILLKLVQSSKLSERKKIRIIGELRRITNFKRIKVTY